MGNLVAHTEDELDPTTGLTTKQQQAIKATWSKFREDYIENGAFLFVELFTLYPDYMMLFRDFSNETAATLPKNPRFNAHVLAVLYQVTAMVENVDNSALLGSLVRKNALSHTRRNGVTPTHFSSLCSVLKDVLQKKLGPKLMTPTAISGWDTLCEVLLSVTKGVYDETATTAAAKYKHGTAQKGKDTIASHRDTKIAPGTPQKTQGDASSPRNVKRDAGTPQKLASGSSTPLKLGGTSSEKPKGSSHGPAKLKGATATSGKENK